jgi:single-strand DNA-binding protein
MNQVALVGNITDDPTLLYTQSGKAVANFTLAVSHRSKANGQWNDVTDGFFSVTCWNSLADNVSTSLKKGSRVVVAGKLAQRSFEVKGNKRTVIEIVASHVATDLTFATAEINKASKMEQPAS